jgi:alpha-amylase
MTRDETTRRALLRGAGAAALALPLAGCASDDSGTPSQDGSPSTNATPSGTPTGTPAASTDGRSVSDARTIYQYYHTDWTEITETLPTLAAQGYDTIQVPPAQHSRIYEREQDENNQPPLGYQPIDLQNFDSEFGTEAEYEEMIATAHENGIEVIADAVANHMAAGDTYFERRVTVEDLPQFTEDDFHESCSIDYQDPESVENCWLLGLRDLDQSQDDVNEHLRNYIEKYANLGADGIRWDGVKHIPESWFSDHGEVWADELGLYTLGEVFDDRVDTVLPYTETGMSTATDYPLYNRMQTAFDTYPSGDLTALDGPSVHARRPEKALTFVANHDSGPADLQELAYAYILTQESDARVYSGVVPVEDDAISTLIDVRNGVTATTSTRHELTRTELCYEWDGDLLVAFNVGADPVSLDVTTDFADTTLTDATDTGDDVEVGSDGAVTVDVPPEEYVCYREA